MTTVYKLRNISGADGEWNGQDIADNELYVISVEELDLFRSSQEVFQAIANEELRVENETLVFENPVEGWNYLEGDNLPKSDLDGRKLAVHTSYKPDVPGLTTYAVWTGAGDDIDNGVVGDGDLLHFDMVPGQATTTKELKFLPSAGRVWIHEAYLKFTDGGEGDYLTSQIVAPATTLQNVANLDLELDGDEIKYAAGGAGTGTHGFAATPVLVPRKFSMDGFWDYDGTNLTPNPAGTGEYKIFQTKQGIHRYVNKIPCYGTCSTYFSMSSDETTELPQPYYIEVTCHNVSDTTWHASVIAEIYRQQTA